MTLAAHAPVQSPAAMQHPRPTRPAQPAEVTRPAGPRMAPAGPYTGAPQRHWFGTAAELLEVPHRAGHQLASFERFLTHGIAEVFADLSPISDHTGKNATLELAVPPEGPLGEPKYTEADCRDRELTYCAPLYADARLHVLRTGEIKESRL